jgi:hypothetical protein
MSRSPARVYQDWHDRPPEDRREVPLQRGNGLRLLGTAKEIFYRSDKWKPRGSRKQRYVHPFESDVKVYEGCPKGLSTAAELGVVEYLDFTRDGQDQTLDFTTAPRLPVMAGAASGGPVLVLVDESTGQCWTLRGGRLRITPRGITG